MRAHGSFTVAAALMSPEMLQQSLLYPKQSVELDMTFQNVMSVDVPRYHFKTTGQNAGEVYPYGFAQTTADLDMAIARLDRTLDRLLELAEVEKACQLMADAIESTRRRVNALEYRTIPDLEETIKFIRMKLDENERSTITRLMKVKEMISDDNESKVS